MSLSRIFSSGELLLRRYRRRGRMAYMPADVERHLGIDALPLQPDYWVSWQLGRDIDGNPCAVVRCADEGE